jgi:hypothetical protein
VAPAHQFAPQCTERQQVARERVDRQCQNAPWAKAALLTFDTPR